MGARLGMRGNPYPPQCGYFPQEGGSEKGTRGGVFMERYTRRRRRLGMRGNSYPPQCGYFPQEGEAWDWTALRGFFDFAYGSAQNDAEGRGAGGKAKMKPRRGGVFSCSYSEEQIGFYAEFFIQRQNAIKAGFLFSVQPLSDRRLIDAECIRKLLPAQMFELHQFFNDILKGIHKNIMRRDGSKVLTRVF